MKLTLDCGARFPLLCVNPEMEHKSWILGPSVVKDITGRQAWEFVLCDSRIQTVRFTTHEFELSECKQVVLIHPPTSWRE